MRTHLSLVAAVILSGCAGTRDSQRAGQHRGSPPHATPVVIEQPSLSDRLNYSRQRASENSATAMTEVEGGIKE